MLWVDFFSVDKRSDRAPPYFRSLGSEQPTPGGGWHSQGRVIYRNTAVNSISLGCLLDFLKTDEGSRLSLPRLIDMSAQVCELPRAVGPEGTNPLMEAQASLSCPVA